MTRKSRAPAGGLDDQEEAGLVEAAATGSEEALGLIFLRYSEAVYALAYRITGTIEDAEDVLQDVFVGMARALRRYEECGRFRSWLLKVTARVALLRVRHRSRVTFEHLDALPGSSDGPGRAATAILNRIEVEHALAAMPPSLRIVFLLKEVEGYDHSEIAALLDISPGASRARLHRAWRFLDRRVAS